MLCNFVINESGNRHRAIKPVPHLLVLDLSLDRSTTRPQSRFRFGSSRLSLFPLIFAAIRPFIISSSFDLTTESIIMKNAQRKPI
jgi:hypothetical protein